MSYSLTLDEWYKKEEYNDKEEGVRDIKAFENRL